jgi:hypothetical protein
LLKPMKFNPDECFLGIKRMKSTVGDQKISLELIIRAHLRLILDSSIDHKSSYELTVQMV